MSKVRVLVGTRKGAFILTSDGARKRWKVSGPHFAGWEIYHMKGSPVDPKRIFASQCSGWFGQTIQRSDDGGKSWEGVGNDFAYASKPGTHQWYDGTQHPWEFKRVWHLEPSLTDPETVYAGVEDAALFRSSNGGKNWEELSGLRDHDTGPKWQPGAGGMCLHTILLDPKNPQRIFVAISAAGAFRSDDAGGTWRPINRGLKSEFLPDSQAEVGHCVHRIALHPSRPETLFMQKHWDVMRRPGFPVARRRCVGKGAIGDPWRQFILVDWERWQQRSAARRRGKTGENFLFFQMRSNPTSSQREIVAVGFHDLKRDDPRAEEFLQRRETHLSGV